MNMALDQLLLEMDGDVPILRVYDWSHSTVSYGYFHTLVSAQQSFAPECGEDLCYIRRWTGGGVVDHRVDVTYTLIIPRSEKVSRSRGGESYRLIHTELAGAMEGMGQAVQLEEASFGGPGVSCFTNPVPYDLCDLTGVKVAGAGQRRSRYGLLHQGSVIPSMERSLFRKELAELLGSCLAKENYLYQPGQRLIDEASALAEERYESELWAQRR